MVVSASCWLEEHYGELPDNSSSKLQRMYDLVCRRWIGYYSFD
eukprot:CAMPEP_0201932894 /NCGR_PEP_ID=MMETSP0903-20130614/30439_1 /ASSEMBLY_ACC=CAM_ASM_000552 /TAXON_ID=420261 /ORGANISM="Thalassiosira antarctica, Strain CCMP982" /LENGTH=42 /DNA_ID= /DNA_START= /DNA_END= /DNA_ORIENTATION=